MYCTVDIKILYCVTCTWYVHMCTFLLILFLFYSFLVMVEVQTVNLLSEEECREIFGDYDNWKSNLLRASLRDANTAFEVVRILDDHQFSEESRALKGLSCIILYVRSRNCSEMFVFPTTILIVHISHIGNQVYKWQL